MNTLVHIQNVLRQNGFIKTVSIKNNKIDYAVKESGLSEDGSYEYLTIHLGGGKKVDEKIMRFDDFVLPHCKGWAIMRWSQMGKRSFHITIEPACVAPQLVEK